MRKPNHKLEISTVLWFLLALHVSGQGAEPRLVNTMDVMANTLNSRGNISWTEELPDVFGATYTMTSSLTEVKADSSTCSLSWTSIYTSSDDKLVESYVLSLKTVSSADVQPYSEYRQSEFEQKVTVSPETYVVAIKTSAPLRTHRELYHRNKLKAQKKIPVDREARILFAEERTANTFVDNIRQTAKLCGETKSGS